MTPGVLNLEPEGKWRRQGSGGWLLAGGQTLDEGIEVYLCELCALVELGSLGSSDSQSGAVAWLVRTVDTAKPMVERRIQGWGHSKNRLKRFLNLDYQELIFKQIKCVIDLRCLWHHVTSVLVLHTQ